MKTITQPFGICRLRRVLALLALLVTSQAIAQSVAPATRVAGLSASYYRGYFNNDPTFFQRATPGVIDRIVPQLHFPQSQEDIFGVGPVAVYYSPNRPDEFSGLFQGRIYITNAGTYTFYLSSDDAASLWFDQDEQPTAQNTDDMRDFQRTQAKKTLSAGYHDIRVLYGEHGGSQGLILEYDGPGMPRQVVPNGVLYPHYEGAAPAPVLTQFDVTKNGQEIHLAWTTETERDCQYFVVERSADGVNFTAIGRETGAGDSQQPRAYAFVDQTPIVGTNYYRLRQVLSTDEVQSPIKNATIEAIPTTISVFPNPNAGRFTVYIKQTVSAGTTLELVDMNGQSQYRKELPANGFETSYLIQPELATGVYMLRLRGAGGVSNHKVLINK